MSLIEHHHHYHFHAFERELDMAVTQAFQNQLDRLAQLVTADRSSQAVTIAKAVAAQAEADSAELQTAHDQLAAAVAQHETDSAALTAANTDLSDQVAALQAKLDELASATPVPAPEPAPADTASAPAAVDTPAGGAAPTDLF